MASIDERIQIEDEYMDIAQRWGVKELRGRPDGWPIMTNAERRAVVEFNQEALAMLQCDGEDLHSFITQSQYSIISPYSELRAKDLCMDVRLKKWLKMMVYSARRGYFGCGETKFIAYIAHECADGWGYGIERNHAQIAVYLLNLYDNREKANALRSIFGSIKRFLGLLRTLAEK